MFIVLYIELSEGLLAKAGTPEPRVMQLLRDAGYAVPKSPEGNDIRFFQGDFEACKARLSYGKPHDK
jgi:hypothetical protein